MGKRKLLYIYHYTSEEGAEAILESGFINMSTDKTRDAMAGQGVYLTSIPPDADDDEILDNNYDDGTGHPTDKVAVCFRFRRRNLPGVERVKSSRDIWICPYPIDITETRHKVIWRDVSYNDNGPEGCVFCGETNHTWQTCRHGTYITCYACKQPGHKAHRCHWGTFAQEGNTVEYVM